MAWYAVSCELRDPDADTARVDSILRTAQRWRQPMPSLWIVESPLVPSQIVDVLVKSGSVTDEDSLVVLEITGAGDHWRVPSADSLWLNEHLNIV